MPITVNKSGVLHELTDVTANVGGTLRALNPVHANVGGVLREIHGALVKEMKWNVQTRTATSFPAATINSTSNGGLTIIAAVLKTGYDVNNQYCVYSDPVKLSAGTKIRVNISSLSGSGTTSKQMSVGINSGGNAVNTSNTICECISTVSSSAAAEYTIGADGEYFFAVIGYSITQGRNPTTYAVTGTVTFEFSH